MNNSTEATKMGRTRKGIYGIGIAVAMSLVALLTATVAQADLRAEFRHEHSRNATEEESRIPNQYIVVFKDSVDHPGALADTQTESHNGDLGFVYRHAIKGYSAEFSKNAVQQLREDPRVKYVEPNRKVEVSSQTIPTGIQRIGATENATAAIDGKDTRVNVDVAVIDTGVDYTHPDLNVYKRVNCVPAGENGETEGSIQSCIENSGTDGSGHGTHVAGTIGALDNGEGVVGVAPGARIWAVRVLGNKGFGTAAWIAAGIDWVKAHASEIEVANMSLGCFCSLPAVEESINSAVSAGVVFAVAAGNEGLTAEGVTPAQNPNVITVSALADYDGKPGGEAQALKPDECKEADKSGTQSWGSDDTFAWFSNWGPPVDVAAPGVCILSTLPGGKYGYLSGTSMASPHVAGAAALLASSSNPNSKADVEAIRAQIVNEGSQNWNDIWTYGNQEDGIGYQPFSEGSYDSTQEPLLDVRPQAAVTDTTRPTNRELTAATLNGDVNPNGKSTSYQFEYGLTEAYGAKTPASFEGIGSGAKDIKVSRAISGLKANLPYHYRVVATNAGGTTYGKDRTLSMPTSFHLLEAKEIEASSAMLRATVDPLGQETSYQFEYGTTESYGATAPASPKSLGAGTKWIEAAQSVNGLPANTVIHYRVKITNGDGTFTSPDGTFRTPAAVIARDATGIDSHAARLEVSVNPIGVATSYQFEWGQTEAYGNKIPLSAKSIGSGTKRLDVSERVEGLSPNTTYHFRAAVTSPSGTTYTEDRSFTTPISEITAGAYPAQVEAKKGVEFALTTNSYYAGPVLCDAPPLAGTLSGRADSIPLKASDAHCHPFGGEFPMKMNGCEFVIHPGNKEPEWGDAAFKGSIDIGGESCTGIDTSWKECQSQVILPQRGLSARYSSEAESASGKSAVKVVLADRHVKYTQAGTVCPAGTYEDGEIFAEWSLEAKEAGGGGSPLGLQILNPPVAETREVTQVDSSTAMLNGIVDNNNASYGFGKAPAFYQFEYGPTSSYGTKVPVSPQEAPFIPAEPKAIPAPVREAISGLEPNRLYHYRLVATNAAGISYGQDGTFTTLAKHVPRANAEKYSASLSGNAIGSQTLTLGTGSNVTCSSVQLSGSLSAASSEPVLQETAGGCKLVGVSATLSMNSCHYNLHVLNSGPPYVASEDIACSKEGDAISINVPKLPCTVTIPPQNGLKGIELANTGSGSERALTVSYNLSGIAYKKVGTGCPEGAGTATNGGYTGATKVVGLDGEGKADGIYLSGEGTQGFFLVGKESGEQAAQPHFDTESHPATVVGTQAAQHAFAFGATAACNEAQFGGSIAEATAELRLTATYSGCKMAGAAATVAMNSCAFVLHLQNSGPPYSISEDVSCTKGGDAIEIKVPKLPCTVKIPAQSGVKGIEATTVGSGAERKVLLTYSISALNYQEEGAGCWSPGSHTNGGYSGTTTLSAFK